MQGLNQPLSFVPQPARHAGFTRQAAAASGPHAGLIVVGQTVGQSVGHAVVQPVAHQQHWQGRWNPLSAGARHAGSSTRAEALWVNNHAVCCGRSQKNPHEYCSIHPQPCASARSERSRAPRCSGLRGRPCLETGCERSPKPFPRRPACAPAPDHRPIRSLPLAHNPGRWSVALRAPQHRIGRAWGRSLRCRSLGLAPAAAATGSVSAGALPSPCSAWALRIAALRSLGRPARVPGWGQGDAYPIAKPCGLRALGHKLRLFPNRPPGLSAAGARRQNALLASALPASSVLRIIRKEITCPHY